MFNYQEFIVPIKSYTLTAETVNSVPKTFVLGMVTSFDFNSEWNGADHLGKEGGTQNSI